MSPFIRVTLSFSLMTIFPLYVVVDGAPAEIGMSLICLPSRTTFMRCELASTVEIWLRPIVNDTVLACLP